MHHFGFIAIYHSNKARLLSKGASPTGFIHKHQFSIYKVKEEKRVKYGKCLYIWTPKS